MTSQLLERNSILFFLVVFLSNVIQCITGFAGTTLAMPFSLMLVDFAVAKPILNVLGLAASIGVVLSNPKAINKHEFCKILSFMLVGIIGGLILTSYVSIEAGILYKVLGIVVIAFTIMGFGNVLSKYPQTSKKTGVLSYIVLAVSGMVHGMFVCGGPLLVVYASKALPDKDEFRTTLSAIWLVLNSIILATDVQSGYFVESTNAMMSISMAVLLFAMVVGNFIARKMNKKVFMILTYILMAISGLSLLIK